MLLASLLIAALASAAPFKRSVCVPSYAPNGQYIDEGCGIVIRGLGDLCMRTDYDTTPGAPVYLDECVAGMKGKSGGRWSVSLGSTQLRNMEAATPEYCLTANAERTAVVVEQCGGAGQDWETSLPWGDPASARIKLKGENVCLQVVGQGVKDQVRLGKCNCDIDQIFNTPGLAP